ncbi:DUF2179 domain-containing protein [[Mycoplasma] falconis]|uniref:DUF2179 domain-containing protein n=1 Tax=[Mycoplasma] falconis TaxID=92403 RepID=A0A501XC27_9BACT|nr:YitT family protein [[Mycoplasma] falconis]TPE58062.1 DUF2179 domain-containing protein [[Mycoplasma] falconis]
MQNKVKNVKKINKNTIDINPYKVNIFNVFKKYPKRMLMILISAILYNVAVSIFLTKAATIATGLSAVAQAITMPILILGPYFAYIYLLLNLPLIIYYWRKNSRLFMICTAWWMLFQVILQSIFLLPIIKSGLHQISIYYVNWNVNIPYSKLIPWEVYGQYNQAFITKTFINLSTQASDLILPIKDGYIPANFSDLINAWNGFVKDNASYITENNLPFKLMDNSQNIYLSDFYNAIGINTKFLNSTQFATILNDNLNIKDLTTLKETLDKLAKTNYLFSDYHNLFDGQTILINNVITNAIIFDILNVSRLYSSGFSNPTWPIIIYTVIGGIMAGIASGLAWKNSGSAGGSDFVVFYISKMKQKSVGRTSSYVALFFCTVSVAVISLLEGIGVAQGKPLNVGGLILRIISSFGYIFLYTAIIELIYPKYKKVKIDVYTKKPDLVISHFKNINYWHGFNIERVIGGFTNTETTVIETYVLFLELKQIKEQILKADPHAWIATTRVNKVVGKFDTSKIE